jgi:hypothetical protein
MAINWPALRIQISESGAQKIRMDLSHVFHAKYKYLLKIKYLYIYIYAFLINYLYQFNGCDLPRPSSIYIYILTCELAGVAGRQGF